MARARARVSVGGFMVLVLLVGAGLGWTVRKARMQREAVAAVEKAGGFVTYDFGLDASRTRIPRRPRFIGWLDRCIGRDYIYSVVEVVFLGNLSDSALETVGRLPGVEAICYAGTRSSVTNAGLAHLAGLTNLKELNLSETGITDAGLVTLKGMKSLQRLELCGTRITDAGLEHLSGLSSLQILDLSFTDIRRAGIVHLTKLTHLRSLNVQGTVLDDFAVQEILRALPNVSVSFQSIDAR